MSYEYDEEINRLGRQPGGRGLGPGGSCLCTQCGYIMGHTQGQPCNTIRCPECDGAMIRCDTCG